MTLSVSEIKNLIEQAFPDAEVRVMVTDEANGHYAAHVVSTAFEGKTRFEQQDMVRVVLADHMREAAQMLSIQTDVPNQE